MIQVREVGLEGVQGALRRFPLEVRRQMPAMVKEAAEPVKLEAQGIVPVRTGTIFDSIRITGGLNKAAVSAGGKRAFYARFVEYGTKKMAAIPFLRPAVERKGHKAREVIEREMRAIIGRVFG